MKEKKRFAAKLLFQFRTVYLGKKDKMRTTEERTVLISHRSADGAYAMASRLGLSRQYTYTNDAGSDVYFEFIGVLDLLHLGLESEENEVWYDIKRALMPMERKESLIPDKKNLAVFKQTPQKGTLRSGKK